MVKRKKFNFYQKGGSIVRKSQNWMTSKNANLKAGDMHSIKIEVGDSSVPTYSNRLESDPKNFRNSRVKSAYNRY
jgi:hypothetical protein